MTIEALQESDNRELKIDDTDLGAESINIPILHNKYLQHFNKFSLLLKKAEYDHRVLKRQKWEYYTGKSETPFPLKLIKTDVPIYLEADQEYQKSVLKAKYLNQMVDAIKTILSAINNRSFHIKNAVEFAKFLKGYEI